MFEMLETTCLDSRPPTNFMCILQQEIHQKVFHWGPVFTPIEMVGPCANDMLCAAENRQRQNRTSFSSTSSGYVKSTRYTHSIMECAQALLPCYGHPTLAFQKQTISTWLFSFVFALYFALVFVTHGHFYGT